MRLRDRVVALAVVWFAILLACSEAGEPEGEVAEPAEPNTKWAEAFARFPRIAVRRNIQGKPAVQTITLNEHAVQIEGKRYDGFRFIVDRSALVEEAQGQGSSSVRPEDFDLVWFFLAPAEVSSWYIVPKQGAMEGFRTFVAPDRLAFKFLEGIEPEDATSIVLQRLEGEHLVDAEEYLIWFELAEDAKTRISFALGYGHKTAEDNSDLAEHLGLSKKSLDERIRDYTRAIEANGDDLRAYYHRGAAWFEKGDMDRAIADLSEVVRIDEDWYEGYVARATVWRRKGEYDKAVEDYGEVVRIRPEAPAAYAERGFCWLALEKHQEAVSDFTRVIEIVPGVAKAHLYRATALARQGEFEKALADCEEARRIDPEQGEVYYVRGEIRRLQNDIERALADYSEAIRLEPDNVKARFQRGLALNKQGELDKAIDDFAAVMLAEGDEKIDWDAVEDSLQAIAAITAKIVRSPNDASHFGLRAKQWQERGDLERAIADYTKVIALDRNNWGAYCERSNLWREKKEYAKELADLKEMVRINPEESQSYWRVARIYALCPDKGLRDSSKALPNAKQACELTKYRDWECLYLLAACYSQAGRFDDAVRWQTEALELAPEGEKEFCRKLLTLYRARRPLK